MPLTSTAGLPGERHDGEQSTGAQIYLELGVRATFSFYKPLEKPRRHNPCSTAPFLFPQNINMLPSSSPIIAAFSRATEDQKRSDNLDNTPLGNPSSSSTPSHPASGPAEPSSPRINRLPKPKVFSQCYAAVRDVDNQRDENDLTYARRP